MARTQRYPVERDATSIPGKHIRRKARAEFRAAMQREDYDAVAEYNRRVHQDGLRK